MTGMPGRLKTITTVALLLLSWQWPSGQAVAADAAPLAELIAIARIPGDLFVPGPVSGQFIDAQGEDSLAALLPFTLGQPLEGFKVGRIGHGHGRRENLWS